MSASKKCVVTTFESPGAVLEFRLIYPKKCRTANAVWQNASPTGSFERCQPNHSSKRESTGGCNDGKGVKYIDFVTS